MDKKKIVELFNSDQFVGRVIKDFASLEIFLGLLLGIYFTSDSKKKSSEFWDLITDNMSFHQKLEVLKKLKFARKYKSLQAIQSLKRLQKLRNLVAHHHYFNDFEMREVFSDKESLRILSDYPNSYRKEIQLTRNRLLRLTSTKEFAMK